MHAIAACRWQNGDPLEHRRAFHTMSQVDPLIEPQARVLCEQLVAVVRAFGARGWTPATSSNFSVRLDAEHLAITVSGRDKVDLRIEDLMVVDLQGRALEPGRRPSAETLLHTSLYAADADLGAVLHTHSRVQTIASMHFAQTGGVVLQSYELIKALHGQSSHEASIRLPVFANSQDMRPLADEVLEWRSAVRDCPGYLIEGHGLYAWGRSLAEAARHLEAFEFMLDCQLQLESLRR